jgi:hypothetical protein
VAARISLFVIAVLSLAWLAVLLRDQEVGQAGRLDDAELLNPDSTWQLKRAQRWFARNQPRRAALEAEALLRSEPENIEALFLLVVTTREIDPRRSAQALAEIRRLNPLARAPRRRR